MGTNSAMIARNHRSAGNLKVLHYRLVATASVLAVNSAVSDQYFTRLKLGVRLMRSERRDRY